ncbi:hypothetical protein C4D60_Mb08t32520 [Musa balbisiana]|uniref:Uncharacterized protein n=1 Tax=Musa balbisiana TaxID=52838 RepID=A0A4S8K846_MUSBA|nr:hypothetical protein C4D60_Mb08t32520 [Musa balbisiana]
MHGSARSLPASASSKHAASSSGDAGDRIAMSNQEAVALLVSAPSLDVEVYAVQHGVPEGPVGGRAAQETVVPVVSAPSLDVEVYAVQHGVPEGPVGGRAAQETVIDVVGDLPGILLGRQAVAADGTAQGEHHLDIVIPLAREDVVAQESAAAVVGVTVAGEVHLWSLAVAELVEEGYEDVLVVAGGTGVS